MILNNRFYIFFITIVYCLCNSSALNDTILFRRDFALYEGSNCSVNNVKGVCKIIEECPRVHLQLSRGSTPNKTCGYNRAKPIICCPMDKTDALPFFIPVNETKSNTSTNNTETDTDLLNYMFINDNSTSPSNYTHSEVKHTPDDTLNVGLTASRKCLFYRDNYCPTYGQNVWQRLAAQLDADEVIGGISSLPKEFKAAAAVGSKTKHNEFKWICGGTLISENFILTAAHCLYTVELGPVTWVRLGDLNLMSDDDDANPKNYKIVKRIKHPAYKKKHLYHDIALLQLEGKVEFNDYVEPVCLSPVRGVDFDPDNAIAIGWGKTDFADDEGSSDLLKVEISLVNHEECNKFYTDDNDTLNQGIIKEWQICAGDEGKDTCQGDSGGALVVHTDRCLHYIIGVTSFGKFCGSNIPAIYSRVSHYVTWIEQIVWPDDFD